MKPISALQNEMSGFQNIVQSGELNVNGANIQGDANIGSLNVSGPTNLADLNVTGNAVFNGDVTVLGNISVATITINGHIITAGNAPFIKIGDAAGTDATATITGNDTSGTISITTGTIVNSGTLVEVDFVKAFNINPKILLTAGNSDTANLKFYRDTATDKFMIDIVDPPTAATTYSFDYMAIE